MAYVASGIDSHIKVHKSTKRKKIFLQVEQVEQTTPAKIQRIDLTSWKQWVWNTFSPLINAPIDDWISWDRIEMLYTSLQFPTISKQHAVQEFLNTFSGSVKSRKKRNGFTYLNVQIRTLQDRCVAMLSRDKSSFFRFMHTDLQASVLNADVLATVVEQAIEKNIITWQEARREGLYLSVYHFPSISISPTTSMPTIIAEAPNLNLPDVIAEVSKGNSKKRLQVILKMSVTWKKINWKLLLKARFVRRMQPNNSQKLLFIHPC